MAADIRSRMHDILSQPISDRRSSPLTLYLAPSFHVRSGSEELMRLLPGRRSGSPSDTSHVSLLLEEGAGALESALGRVVRGTAEEIEGVVIREIGRSRVSLMPLRDVEGRSAGAVLLIYPERRPQDASSGLLDSVDSVYEVNLQTGGIRVAIQDQRKLDATQELVTYLEPDLRIRWANKAAATSAGMEAKDMAGRRCYEVWQGRDSPCDDCPVARAAESLSPEEGEVTTPDGRRLLIRSYPITDTGGTLVGFVEFGRDISRQHKTEEALRKTAGLLESILENSPYPISVLDTEGHYVMVNQATTKLYSLPRETLIGHHLTEFLPDETGYLFDRRIRRLVKEKRPVTVEDEISKGDEMGVFYTTLFPIWDDNGEIGAIGGITTDVTELKTAQELAERADAQKASLLEAVHAGVKGNLQAISKLIEVDHRSDFPSDPVSLLRRTQVRLRAMSLVYQRNDDAETLGAVDLATYAQSLVNEVIQAYECENNVSLSLWADPVVAPLDFGLAFGLILAELIANICLNAFVPHQGGLLEVTISDDNQAITLRVTDGSSGTQIKDGGERRALVTLGSLVQEFRGAIRLDVGNPRTWEVILPLAPEDRI